MADDRNCTEQPAQDPLEGLTDLRQQAAARAQMGTAALHPPAALTARARPHLRRAALLRRAHAFQVLTPILLSEMARRRLEQQLVEAQAAADEALTLDGEAVMAIDRPPEPAVDQAPGARPAPLDHLYDFFRLFFRWCLPTPWSPRPSTADDDTEQRAAIAAPSQSKAERGERTERRGEAFAGEE